MLPLNVGPNLWACLEIFFQHLNEMQREVRLKLLWLSQTDSRPLILKIQLIIFNAQ